ncbi:hypothetical protein [Hazenella coriacea]|nr:hypothetical protein [Hazenella coriacea]
MARFIFLSLFPFLAGCSAYTSNTTDSPMKMIGASFVLLGYILIMLVEGLGRISIRHLPTSQKESKKKRIQEQLIHLGTILIGAGLIIFFL